MTEQEVKEIIGIRDLKRIYGGSDSFYRINLCNGDFNKFIKKGFKYYNCPELHHTLKDLLERRKLTKYGNERKNRIYSNK